MSSNIFPIHEIENNFNLWVGTLSLFLHCRTKINYKVVYFQITLFNIDNVPSTSATSMKTQQYQTYIGIYDGYK